MDEKTPLTTPDLDTTNAVVAARTLLRTFIAAQKGTKLGHVTEVIFFICAVVEKVATTLSLDGEHKLAVATQIAQDVIQLLHDNDQISQETLQEMTVIVSNSAVLAGYIGGIIKIAKLGGQLQLASKLCCPGCVMC
jgi:Na+(H+)/acetate symporter ActP